MRIEILKLTGVIHLALAGASAFAQDAAPAPDWTLRDGAWKSKALPLGYFFQISVDGRTFIPTQKSSANNPAASDKPPGENELVATFDGKPITVRREMKFDPKRQAIRILDIFTNSSDQEREVRVDYNTSLSGSNIRYNGAIFPGGEVREYGNGAPEDAMGAVVLAEKAGSDAVPLFVWGHRDAKWPVSLSDFSSSIRLSYSGTIAKGGKIALLHWIATAGLERGVKLEQTFDRFLKKGTLVDPMVPAEIAPLVMNFKPDAFGKVEDSAPAASSVGRLVALEVLLKKLDSKRGDKDMLWMNKEAQLTGVVAVGKVSLQSRAGEIAVPFSSIAALRGGGGRGREHQIYLRDGSVLAGRIVLTGAKLTGDIGATTLDADAMEYLILRSQPQDGQMPKEAQAFAQWQGGELRWLGKNGAGGADVLTVFGRVKISAADLWLIERRKEPPFDLAVTLRDGSRFRGVLGESALQLDMKPALTVPAAELARWGAAGALETADGENKTAPLRWCSLRDGSMLCGTLAAGELLVRAASGEMKVKTADIVRLTRKSGTDETVLLELITGGKLEAELLDDALLWKLGSQTLELPASMISELVLPVDKIVVATPDPFKTADEIMINHDDPAAPPNGFGEDSLITVSPQYPKPMFIGVPVPSGNIPNLEKPDLGKLKSRLTFKAPRGTVNLAKGMKVTSSDAAPIFGALDLVTDGDADGSDGSFVELAPGVQWVQIDLGKRCQIWKILLWHFHKRTAIYLNVVVQAGDDPDFNKGITTIFNNDHDNRSGLGKGSDKTYVETNHGRLMDAGGIKARYVRFYSNGSTANEMNHYIEAAVYGTPLK